MEPQAKTVASFRAIKDFHTWQATIANIPQSFPDGGWGEFQLKSSFTDCGCNDVLALCYKFSVKNKT